MREKRHAPPNLRQQPTARPLRRSSCDKLRMNGYLPVTPIHPPPFPPHSVVPAKAGIHPPPSPITPAPPPSFRRRPESRTPVYAALTQGPGVDSRFRGNDGGAGRDYGMNGGNDDGRGLPGFWIPAYAGMTVGAGGNDGMAGGNDDGGPDIWMGCSYGAIARPSGGKFADCVAISRFDAVDYARWLCL